MAQVVYRNDPSPRNKLEEEMRRRMEEELRNWNKTPDKRGSAPKNKVPEKRSPAPQINKTDKAMQEASRAVRDGWSAEDTLADAMVFAELVLQGAPDMKGLLAKLKKEDAEAYKKFRTIDAQEIKNILKVVKEGSPDNLNHLASILEYKRAVAIFLQAESQYFNAHPASTLDRAMISGRFDHPEFQLTATSSKLKTISESEAGSPDYIAALTAYQQAIEAFKKAEMKYFKDHPASTSDRAMRSNPLHLDWWRKLFWH
jgi:hypothetical protein